MSADAAQSRAALSEVLRSPAYCAALLLVQEVHPARGDGDLGTQSDQPDDEHVQPCCAHPAARGGETHGRGVDLGSIADADFEWTQEHVTTLSDARAFHNLREE